MKAKANEKSAYRTLRLAVDIHRRCLKLQADWTAFDPYGAVVYDLMYLADNGMALREDIFNSKDDWNLVDENLRVRPIAPSKKGYALFKEEIKGIEGALRRLYKEPYAKGREVVDAMKDAFKDNIRSLRAVM